MKALLPVECFLVSPKLVSCESILTCPVRSLVKALLIPSPGCLMYLCFWYPPSVRATRMAFFSASITVAGTLTSFRSKTMLIPRCFRWSHIHRCWFHVWSRRSLRLAMAVSTLSLNLLDFDTKGSYWKVFRPSSSVFLSGYVLRVIQELVTNT